MNNIPSIFDLQEDENDILRMPFNPIDYGKNNDIKRHCYECDKEYSQGKMKELGSSKEDEKAYCDDKKWWPCSIFFCEECWKTSELSDASNWVA